MSLLQQTQETTDQADRRRESAIALVTSPMILGPVLASPQVANLPIIKREADPLAYLSDRLQADFMFGGGDMLRIRFAGSTPDLKQEFVILNAVIENVIQLGGASDAEVYRRRMEALSGEQDELSLEFETLLKKQSEMLSEAEPRHAATMARLDMRIEAVRTVLQELYVQQLKTRIDGNLPSGIVLRQGPMAENPQD